MTKIKLSIHSTRYYYGQDTRSLLYSYIYRNKISFSLIQRAKKVVSDSPGLVVFAIGLVNSVLKLPDGQRK